MMQVGTRIIAYHFLQPMPIRTFVVDRQEVVRRGLTLACNDTTDIEVVGSADSLSGGFDEILLATPDVVVVDFRSNDALELATVHRILSTQPNINLLAFGVDDSQENVQAILNSGVRGYITKDASLAEVIIAVRAIREGRIFISHSHPSSTGPKASCVLHRATIAAYGRSESEPLSAREREVILLLAEGLTNKEVAKRLYLSVKTVETYRSRVMKKYQLRGRSELFSFAKLLSESGSDARPMAIT
jgi:DNA-binding NarL/FixJ family response regulator